MSSDDWIDLSVAIGAVLLALVTWGRARSGRLSPALARPLVLVLSGLAVALVAELLPGPGMLRWVAYGVALVLLAFALARVARTVTAAPDSSD